LVLKKGKAVETHSTHQDDTLHQEVMDEWAWDMPFDAAVVLEMMVSVFVLAKTSVVKSMAMDSLDGPNAMMGSF
jgi:hypothetical protein